MSLNKKVFFARIISNNESKSFINDDFKCFIQDTQFDLIKFLKNIDFKDNKNGSFEISNNSRRADLTYSFYKDLNEIIIYGSESETNESLKIKNFEDTLKLLGEMTSGVAHDLNNPLSGIIASVSLAKMNLEDMSLNNKINKQVLNETLEMMDEIQVCSSRISEMISGIKAYTHQGSLVFKDEYLLQVVKNSVSFCKGFLKSNDIDLTIKSELVSKGIISILAPEITRVIVNLINNSKDAIKNLTRNRKWIEIKIYEDASNMYVSITDGGRGIPMEIQNKIFDSFFTTKGYGEGTGLGLSQAKSTMKKHNGDIVIDNENKNTSFILKFQK